VVPATNVPLNDSVRVSPAARLPAPRSQRPDAGEVSNVVVSRVSVVPALGVHVDVSTANEGLPAAGALSTFSATPACWPAVRSTLIFSPSAPVPSTITRL
jgi:hypothetical protein